MNQGYRLLEAAVLSGLCGLAIASLGWTAVPCLAAICSVALSCRKPLPPNAPHPPPSLTMAAFVTVIMGALLGMSREAAPSPTYPDDPPPAELRGNQPGSGNVSSHTEIVWGELAENPTPTFEGWRATLYLRGQIAFLRGGLEPPIPLKGDAIVARCKSTVKRPPTCRIIQPGIISTASPDYHRTLNRIRFKVIRAFLNPVASEASRSAAALSTGAKSLLTPARRDQLARLGLLHLWAVSGLHVLIVAGFTCFLFGRIWGICFPGFARPAPRVLGAISALPAVFIYASFVGGGPSTLRATTAYAIFAILQWSRRSASGRHLWILTCGLELSQPTQDLISPGSLLSHAAAAGIIFLFSGTSGDSTKSSRGWKNAVASTIRAGVAATVATAPFSLAFFNSIAPMGVLYGILWVPLVSILALPLCMLSSLAVACAVPPPITTELIRCTSGLMELATRSLDLLDSPWLRMSVMPGWAPAVAPAAIFLLAGWPGSPVLPSARRTFRFSFGLMIFLMWCGAQVSGWTQQRGTEIAALSVGRGDAFVIRIAPERVILIDLGPGTAQGVRSHISPERLRRLGISSIELLILTHRHQDHFGGAFRISPDIPIGRCIRPSTGDSPGSRDWRALTSSMATRKQRCEPVVAGQIIRGPDFEVNILFPTQAHANDFTDNENQASLIAALRTSQGKIWITGDSPQANEIRVVGTSPTNFRGGVLLVPHHGSTTSSSMDLLNQLRPDGGVISHGKNIPKKTEKKYWDMQIPICGTFPHGSVQVRLFNGFTILPMGCLWERPPPLLKHRPKNLYFQ